MDSGSDQCDHFCSDTLWCSVFSIKADAKRCGGGSGNGGRVNVIIIVITNKKTFVIIIKEGYNDKNVMLEEA